MDSLFPPRSLDGVDEVFIVGGGFSGLVCALRLAPRAVTIVTAGKIGERHDQALHNMADRFASAGEDDGLADRRLAEGVLAEAPARLAQLEAHGVIAGNALDAAAATPALAERARATHSIQLLEGFVVEQLRAEDSFVTGLVARDRRGGLSDRMLIPARAIVLATGGIADLYGEAGDRPSAFGEGLGMAARAGVLIADPEFVEFCGRRASGTHASPSVARHVGGVHIDGRGRSTLDGLWACGEVACSGAMGAGSSDEALLREALVVASRTAEDILGQMPRRGRTIRIAPPDAGRPFAAEHEDETLSRLRGIMRRHVGPVRDRQGLVSALAMIERLLADVRSPRIRNSLTTAQLITAGALLREESRGVHRRSDFPGANPRFERRTFLTRADAESAGRRASSLRT